MRNIYLFKLVKIRKLRRIIESEVGAEEKIVEDDLFSMEEKEQFFYIIIILLIIRVIKVNFEIYG
jgi:hypothetical protein